MRRGFAETRNGQVHFVREGEDGEAVLLLHQTPRSWDEYRDVIPLLAERYQVVAMDTIGFGASDSPSEPWTVEMFAGSVVDLVDALELERFNIVGHHTGGVVGIEVAAMLSSRVPKLILSGVPFVDQDRRDLVAHRSPIDGVQLSNDGTHFQDLWNKRREFYPADRPDLLHRLMIDAVRMGDRAEEGHLAVNSYRMEDRIGLVQATTLVLCGEFDYFSLPDMAKLIGAIPGARTEVLPALGVAAVDEDPEIFAAAVDRFLRDR